MNAELASAHGSFNSTSELAFLAGGGESGARMRAVDWSGTALGPPEHWPRSLKTIVRMMLDSRYAMWMLWGPEYTFFCNDAYLPTVGIKRDWVMGARSDKVWAEVWSYIAPRLEVVNLGVATWDEALQLFLERSGFPEETYHTFSYSPVYDDENRIGGMLCVVTEVTERVLAERGLKVLADLSARAPRASVEEALGRAMLVLQGDQLDVPFAALYLLDNSQRRGHLTSRFGRIPVSLSRDEFSIDDDTAGPLSRACSRRTPELIEFKDTGEWVPSPLWPEPVPRALVLPITGVSGSPAGLLVAGVSPRRKLDDNYRRFFDLVAGQLASVLADAQTFEAERRRAESLAELDRAKTQFFSNVSHEFRTPLTLMLGPLEEALADADIAPAMRERLRLTQRNAFRLLRLVNSLLDFARIEAGRLQAEFRPSDLAALTQDLASTFRSAIEKARLHFDVQVSELPAPVWVDRDLWEKVVFNLLSNAYKFTMQGAITVDLHAEDGMVVLEVRDTGVGVPADALPRLFDRFYRVKDSGGRTHEGSGIGLALVQELVKLHGGSITARSQLGEGTTFRVTLPFGSEHLPQDRLREAAPAPAPSPRYLDDVFASSDEPPHDERGAAADPRFQATFGASVLIVDDNADMRRYVSGLLEPSYRVEAVNDGVAALEAVRRRRPDMILSDVMMPRLDGFGLIKALRADQSLRDIPVILLSARAGEESRIEGLDAGADDYLVKPFSARELAARVGALLERSRLHRAMQHRNAQYVTLVDEAPMGVFVLDSNLRFREVNPQARPAFGDPSNLIGADLREVVREQWEPAYAAEILQRFQHTLDTGEPYLVPERIERRADRKQVEAYEWRISRIVLPDGTFGVVCYFRDISAQVNTRLALEGADRQKDDFLAMLAHELRNPLAPIRTASELLKRTSQPDERARGAIDIVKRQVNHLTRLVDDLLDISRITRARIELKREDVSVARIIEQALETVEPMRREKNHRVTTRNGHEPVYVNGDPARLVQCVANLLTNAIKYTDPNGELSVQARSEGNDAVITVSDNGTGIAAELLPQIFDLFVQSKRTLDRSQGGLGIGLSVVKRLVEMHGGSVTAQSDGVGRGSTFSIRLPKVSGIPETSQESRAAQGRALRIMVVDDNRDAAESLAMLMSLDGHEVRAVFAPSQALDQLPEFRPEVMLLDIGLPEMDGYEVARRVRASMPSPAMRLIALTGYGQTEDRQRALAAGFDDHLVKPVEPAKLQQALMRD